MAKQKESEIVEMVIAPVERLSVGKMLEAAGKVWDTLEPAFAHGCSEVGAVIGTGSAFVMYQHGEVDQQQHGPAVEHGLPIEAVKQPEMTTPGHEMER